MRASGSRRAVLLALISSGAITIGTARAQDAPDPPPKTGTTKPGTPAGTPGKMVLAKKSAPTDADEKTATAQAAKGSKKPGPVGGTPGKSATGTVMLVTADQLQVDWSGRPHTFMIDELTKVSGVGIATAATGKSTIRQLIESISRGDRVSVTYAGEDEKMRAVAVRVLPKDKTETAAAK